MMWQPAVELLTLLDSSRDALMLFKSLCIFSVVLLRMATMAAPPHGGSCSTLHAFRHAAHASMLMLNVAAHRLRSWWS